MKFITTEQLFDKFKEKKILELSDFLNLIEEEFDVSLRVEGGNEDNIDVKALAEDPDIIRQVKASREDRKSGRTYTGEKGLEILREKIREIERDVYI